MAKTTSQATKRAEISYAAPLATIHRVEADGVRVFYRAAGDASAPVVLLLHGFPSSSFMFRELIPRLATDYRVIAPDLPGFGFTEVPAERKYAYTFDGLASTIETFTQALKLDRYAIYVFDYGAPTGLRLAMAHPSESRRSSRKTGTHTKQAWATHGARSANTGLSLPRRTARSSATTFSRLRERAGSTHMAWPIRRAFRRSRTHWIGRCYSGPGI